jgi:hypothetical protein
LCDVSAAVEATGVRLRPLIDQANVGDTLKVNGVRLTITSKRKKPISDCKNGITKKRRTVEEKAPERAMRMFLQGMTMVDIQAAWPTSIQHESICSYIRKAAFGMTREELQPLAIRLGLGQDRDAWTRTLESFGKAVAEIEVTEGMSTEEYSGKYLQVVLQYFPSMRETEDWRVVRGVWKTLMST